MGLMQPRLIQVWKVLSMNIVPIIVWSSYRLNATCTGPAQLPHPIESDGTRTRSSILTSSSPKPAIATTRDSRPGDVRLNLVQHHRCMYICVYQWLCPAIGPQLPSSNCSNSNAPTSAIPGWGGQRTGHRHALHPCTQLSTIKVLRKHTSHPSLQYGAFKPQSTCFNSCKPSYGYLKSTACV